MSDEAPPEPPATKEIPVALFHAGEIHVLMSLDVSANKTDVIYRLMLPPNNILTLSDATALRALLDEVIRQGVSVTTHVFSDKKT